MNRRALIGSAPVAAFVTALTAGNVHAACGLIVEKPETPVAAAYREWATFSHWLNKVASDDEFDAQVDRRTEMEEALFDLPAEGVEDVMLKLMVYSDHGNDVRSDYYETPERIIREGMTLMGMGA